MRPITGIGNARSDAATSASACPAPRVAVGRTASPALGSASSGSAPEPIWLAQSIGSTTKSLPNAAATAPCMRRASASMSCFGRASSRMVGKSLRQPIRVAVELERRLERRQPDLVDAQRALYRVLVDPRQKMLAADDEPGLRATQQLVARERDQIGAVGDGFSDGRLVREPETREVDQRSGAEVVHERDTTLARKCCELACCHLRGETLDPVVRRVNLEHQPGLRSDCGDVVALVSAIGGADLDELGAGAAHDFG